MERDSGLAVLVRLASGTALDRVGEEWRQGRREVSAADVAALVRCELLRMDGAAAQLTELGRLRVERAIAPERPQRWLTVRGNAGRERITHDLNESPLGWLMRRHMITPRQFEAGERLRTDYLMAARYPSVTMRWSSAPRGRAGPPDMLDPTEAQIAAKQRFAAACRAVGGGLTEVLERVVCLGEGLTAAERALGWPARAGKVVLAIALDRLADHYRI